MLTILITIVVGFLGYYYGNEIVTFDWDFSFPFMNATFGNLPNGNRRLFGLSIYKNEQ